MTSMPPDGWAALRSAHGGSASVPASIERMLHARSPEEATAAYWEIDNRVVVQGQLYESAEEVGAVVIEAVCQGGYTQPGLSRALDLLVEIAYGEAHHREAATGDADLGPRCRLRLRPNLNCVKALVDHHDERVVLGVLDLVDKLEDDPVERRDFASTLPRSGWSPALLARLRESFP